MSPPLNPNSPFAKRRAGILLHPTSLPGDGDGGELGAEAFRFVDFLASAGIGVWQMLPLGPTHADRSPYQCTSVNAGNPRLISLQRLVEWGWLVARGVATTGCGNDWRCNQLCAAYAGFQSVASPAERAEFADFRATHAAWLDDFALYEALRADQQGRGWFDWSPPLRDRDPQSLAEARRRLAVPIEQVCFNQFAFFRQWHDLRRYANENGVLLFGDVPIFVAYDSAEVWAHREYFRVDAAGRLEVVAGVPPDYFSATGQRWGNPHYRWERIEQDGFRWWIERMRTQRELFDLIRIDHFRGFEAYWEIPASAETAIDGHWVKAPGQRLFQALLDSFHDLPLVAEDLGIITPEVDALRIGFGLPGMKILQFSFGGDAHNPYLPHNHEYLSVAYTGTHDNDTTLGWYAGLDESVRAHAHEYLGYSTEAMPWPLIRATFASVAVLAVIPLQDALALGSEHRMNTPGVTEGNWRWRFAWEQLPDDLAERLRQLVELYGR
ncbi:MAG: 4-alpha-glucanotransferase [Gammaproteobacteria bacterium]|nr:4-alpha-glucanotransferase [Gammaproteobacteria bacterium]